MTSIAAYIGAIAGLLGAVVAVVTAISSARKDEVEVLREIIAELQAWRDHALVRIDELQQGETEAKRRICRLEKEVRDWERRYLGLCRWVKAKGLEPPQHP